MILIRLFRHLKHAHRIESANTPLLWAAASPRATCSAISVALRADKGRVRRRLRRVSPSRSSVTIKGDRSCSPNRELLGYWDDSTRRRRVPPAESYAVALDHAQMPQARLCTIQPRIPCPINSPVPPAPSGDLIS